MKKLSLAFAVAAVIGGVSEASSQTYPSRPITVVVAFAAGGSGDTIMRIVADHMRSTLGQTIVIENGRLRGPKRAACRSGSSAASSSGVGCSG